MPRIRSWWFRAILFAGSMVLMPVCIASGAGLAGAAPSVPQDFVHLCHAGNATSEEIAATEAAAIANGYRPESLRARPVQRIGRTAAQPNGVEYGYGYTITWSYLRDGFVLPAASQAPGTAPSTLFATMDQQHSGGFAQWHAKFVEAFARWEAVTGNRYQFEPEDDGAPLDAVGQGGRRGDVRIGMRAIPGSVLAYNNYPSSGSDMVLDQDRDWSDTNFFLNVVMHEHGHGLGLDHVCPLDKTKLMEPILNGITQASLDEILGSQMLYGDPLNHATSGTSDFRRSRQLILGVAPGAVDDYWVDRPGIYAVGAQPLGASYLEGPQGQSGCGPATAINTQFYGDLTVQVLDAGGNLLVDRNTRSAGFGERAAVRLKADQLPARVRVGNSSGNYQMYQLIAGNLLTGKAESRPKELFRDGFEL